MGDAVQWELKCLRNSNTQCVSKSTQVPLGPGAQINALLVEKISSQICKCWQLLHAQQWDWCVGREWGRQLKPNRAK